MFVSLKCVSAKSGTCTLLAPGLMLAVRGTQVAAALFDVEGCFEALSEPRSGGRRFFSLVPIQESDNPICHGHKYAHGIKIHLCAFMSMRACNGIGTRSFSRGRFLKTPAKTYTCFTDTGLCCVRIQNVQ